MLALSSENVNKYEFLTDKDVLLEKGLLENDATIKLFQYSPLGRELRKQTCIPKKQQQELDKVYEFDETISKDDNKPTHEKYKKSYRIYNTNYSFYKYHDSRKFFF